MKTKPEVFIVESLDCDDETEERYEGKILIETLRLAGKKPIYHYVRTKRQLKEALILFKKSKYRYLHLSCHGGTKSISTTLDCIKFQELGEILKPLFKKRRLFISSCLVVNDQLADAVMPSMCLSIMGPTEEVLFDKAERFWSSFYRLAFKLDDKRMRPRVIKPLANELAQRVGVSIAYYARRSSSRRGYRRTRFLSGSLKSETKKRRKEVEGV